MGITVKFEHLPAELAGQNCLTAEMPLHESSGKIETRKIKIEMPKSEPSSVSEPEKLAESSGSPPHSPGQDEKEKFGMLLIGRKGFTNFFR